jgi:lia operon protein LiaF
MRKYCNSDSFLWGILLITLGILFLLQNFGHLNIGYIFRNFWPVILIIIGIRMIILWEKREKPKIRMHVDSIEGKDSAEKKSDPGSSHIDAISYTNTFGDINLNFDDKQITRYSVSNVFGDIDLDFLKSKFDKNSFLKINGVFGNIEIRVPANLQMTVQVSYIAGSSRIFDDHQSGFLKDFTYLTPDSKTNTAKIVIEASVIFGDIRIHS